MPDEDSVAIQITNIGRQRFKNSRVILSLKLREHDGGRHEESRSSIRRQRPVCRHNTLGPRPNN